MLGDGLYNSGTQGSYFRYQYASLKLLEQISAGVPPGGLATEVTALSILSAIQNGQTFNSNLVIDTGGVGCPVNCPTYMEIRIFNTITHTFDPPIYYNASGAVVVPVGPLTYLNPQFILNNILTQLSSIDTNTTGINLEATQLIVKNLLNLIQGDTSNLDVALSTRASEATLLAIDAKLTAPLVVTGPLTDTQLRASAVPVILPGGNQTLTSTTNGPVSAGSTPAGAATVAFITDGTFTGTINGIARDPDTAYIFGSSEGKGLPAIAWVVTTGNMNIDILV